MINFWFSKDYMTGGNIYNQMVFEVLEENGFPIARRKAYLPYHGRGFTYLNALYTFLWKTSRMQDLDIIDYAAATWCSPRFRGKRVIIMFHFDLEETRKKKKHRFFFNRFLKSAQNSKVIVIAQYWKEYLEALGLNDIDVIYCSYNIPMYKPYTSRCDFLQKYNLPDKPIIYLGKNSIPKTLEAYRIVETLATDYLIITTGPVKEFKGPVHLDLNFRDYCSLLHICAVTLLLPRFSEGWSRIAHESLICGTPVIGNGRGGMRELLENTHQLIIDEKHDEEIRNLISGIVISSKRVNQEDILYARQFDRDYFSKHWNLLVNELAPKASKKSR